MAFSFEMVPDATSDDHPRAVWSGAGLEWDYYDMKKIPWSGLRVLASWNGAAAAPGADALPPGSTADADQEKNRLS